jgi:hypothetical protein
MSISRRRGLLTMDSRLSEIPPEWLKYIEPKVVRGSFLPCWIWTGVIDRNGYPFFRHPAHGQIGVRGFITRMFWEYPDNYFVTNICHRINCVNPTHLVVQEKHPRWDPPPRL